MDPPEPPVVTCLLVCYNHERFVVDALESVRLQTYRPLQLVILDDCSADRSRHRIRDWLAWSGLPATYIEHDRNQGLCRTLNEGLRYSTGAYLALLACDDIWLPDKLARQVAILDRLSPSVGMIYSNAYLIDETGQLLPQLYIPDTQPLPAGRVTEQLIDHNFVPAMTTLVRMTCVSTLKGYDESLAYEDYDFWLRLSMKYDVAASDTISACYRRSAKSFSQTREADILRDTLTIFARAHRQAPLYRRLLGRRIGHLATHLYKRGGSGAWRYVWLRLRYLPTSRSLALVVLTLGGLIPWRTLSRIQCARPGGAGPSQVGI